MLARRERVLGEIGAGELPVELVLNKIDAVDPLARAGGSRTASRARCRSRREAGEGLDELRARIAERFAERFEPVRLLSRTTDGARLAELYELGAPIDERSTGRTASLIARAAARSASCARFAPLPDRRARPASGAPSAHDRAPASGACAGRASCPSARTRATPASTWPPASATSSGRASARSSAPASRSRSPRATPASSSLARASRPGTGSRS